MSPIMQQRLIGSILLLCVLAGIAFLLIKSASDDVETIVEAKPEIPFVSSIDAIIEDDVEIVEVQQEALIDAQAPVTTDEIEPQPVVEAAPVPKTPEVSVVNNVETTLIADKVTTTLWSLQLASLADKSAANALTKKVALLGYKAIVEKAETPKGDRFRVRIGPQSDKVALEAISKDIEKKLNLKPLMLKQLPE